MTHFNIFPTLYVKIQSIQSIQSTQYYAFPLLCTLFQVTKISNLTKNANLGQIKNQVLVKPKMFGLSLEISYHEHFNPWGVIWVSLALPIFWNF